ncbi:hypothetical protein DUNSADRAFT_11982 [Dunaliella salina]|uniref:Proteasome assembly chaperone 2 n=1 Tax=Dunaliella salina TaxID=3046 RepID=A0ABQ7GCC9_DUNSA|nr:hypothetical protein DUNSADRAFT_11982 [Dunaliella salina]|eukprot:KAF5832198.1 hypothetical protein DUNSADRAFT_11982 [Dunaliella salina]
MSVIQECFKPEHKAPPLPVLALIGEHDYQAGLAAFLLNQLHAGNALNPIVCLRSSADPLGDQHFLDHAFGKVMKHN